MEMLGFKNLSQNIRTDSEELFKSWLTNGENGYNSTSIAHRTRQASRRLSTELVNLTSQQHGSTSQKKRAMMSHSRKITPQLIMISPTISVNSQSETSARLSLYNSDSLSSLTQAWFHSSQPMTRSRSSELRRRYVAMQYTQKNTVTPLCMTLPISWARSCLQPIHPRLLLTPHKLAAEIKVSSVVNMLKGTLERKKLGNQIEKEIVGDSSNALYHAQGINSTFDKRRGNGIHEIPPWKLFKKYHLVKSRTLEFSQTVQVPMDLDFEGFVNTTNPFQLSTVSREPSQSESSAATPVVSSAFDACDGPSNSSQTLSICETSRKHVGNDFRDRIIDNLKDDRKRGGLVRYGSIKSAGSVDKGDPTKKRRVERSRKMAEAKERNMTPATPSDMQSVLKRCENLEKEVRSLKLNLSFMNRKDSEQTKEIEELQKLNEDLSDEKERLLEEIERILAETENM
ncbi:hypothetical protein OIU78_014007 [Salix suchowensis]|nr:hypothetical protein OIU78_014007 [Salix suchowensis]